MGGEKHAVAENLLANPENTAEPVVVNVWRYVSQHHNQMYPVMKFKQVQGRGVGGRGVVS